MKKIKTCVTGVATYIYQFSMSQTVVAFASGGATIFYLSGTLSGVIGNKIAAYLVSALAGTGVGLVTVYGAERIRKKPFRIFQ